MGLWCCNEPIALDKLNLTVSPRDHRVDAATPGITAAAYRMICAGRQYTLAPFSINVHHKGLWNKVV